MSPPSIERRMHQSGRTREAAFLTQHNYLQHFPRTLWWGDFLVFLTMARDDLHLKTYDRKRMNALHWRA